MDPVVDRDGSVMKIAFDTELKRPGCVLVAAAIGADTDIPSRYFDNDTWLLAPTPAMRVYDVTDEQIPMLVAMANEAIGRTG
jgi:hypothetical protein